MCISKAQLSELNEIVDRLNLIHEAEIRQQYLASKVEDVDFFLNILKKVNKNNLRKGKERSKSTTDKGKYIYQKEDVIDRFQINSLESIVSDSSKMELTAMYYAVYNSKPLSANTKMQIAQAIKRYIHDMQRADVLLG